MGGGLIESGAAVGRGISSMGRATLIQWDEVITDLKHLRQLCPPKQLEKQKIDVK